MLLDRRSWMVLLIAVTSVASLQAQASGRAVVIGVIRDAVTSAPIAGAMIEVEGEGLRTVSDSSGAFRITNVPIGPLVLRAIRLGYAPLRQGVITVPGMPAVVRLQLARSALRLQSLNVVEDPLGRARGELGTASVIGAEAIRNQSAATLAGILELVPGTVLQPPGLDGVQQFGLRGVPIGSGAASGQGRSGAQSASALAAFGTQIILDGVPVSNNVNLQGLGARGELSFATAAGGGIDLQRIPAATLERVEVIRGIPSTRFGDLTQGVVLVETRAGAVSPDARVRIDPRTVEFSLVGGRTMRADAHAFTASANVARTRLMASSLYRDNVGSRLTGQLAHRFEDNLLQVDTRLDAFQLLNDEPPADKQPDLAARSRDLGFRLSERIRWRSQRGRRLELTAALEGLRQRSFTQAPRLRGAMPFTNRVTEGTQDGKFIGGSYVSRVDVDGDPRHLYTRLEGSSRVGWAGLDHDVRVGTEARREWNNGPGYQFDVEFPPQVTFNGANGYDRPRRFDLIPPIVTSAVYVDDHASHTFGSGAVVTWQAGLRLDLLHRGSTWASRTRDHVVQPRIQLEFAPASWIRLRAGAGRLAKVPALADLAPDRQYYDLVNFNWYANVPEERRAILTTRILDRENASLGMSRADKAELGIELFLPGGTFITLVGYADRISHAVGTTVEPAFLLRDRYAVDSSTINQGRPPDVLQPPVGSDTIPVLIDRPDNVVVLVARGLELTALLPEFAPLRTRLSINGAWAWNRFSTSGLDFGTGFGEFQLDERRARSPYWESVVQRGERLLLTARLIHHQPLAGLVITGTTQAYFRDVRVNAGGVDTLAFAGYITRAGNLVRVLPGVRTDAQYSDLRVTRLGVLDVPQKGPVDWLFSVQVSKTLPRDGRLSFYAFNAFDRVGTYTGRTTIGRVFPAMRFGMEVSMQLNPSGADR